MITGPSVLSGSNGAAYIFYLIAGAGAPSSVTIIPSSSINVAISWQRWGATSGAGTADQTATNSHTGTATSSPAATTGTLAQAGELSVAFAALYNGGADPASPVWAGSYSAVTTSAYDGDAFGLLTGANTNAGTTAESPSVSWTNSFGWQAMLVQTFTAAASAPPGPAGRGSEAGLIPAALVAASVS